MIVKTWNNGSYNDSGVGYGVKISKSDRKKFFDRSWENIIVNIGDSKEYVDIPIYDTFWSTCPELRSVKIGEYLIKSGLGTWKKQNPHKLLLFLQDYNKFILMVSNPRKLATWAEGSSFTYDGCVKFGTRIYFGKTGVIEVTKQQYQLLLKKYAGMTISIGTSRDKASIDSLGYWLQKHVTKTAIASYVGRILIQEGYAEKVKDSMIKFN